MTEVSVDLNARIGARVRALREQRALSLEALAERSGVSRSNISLIERGHSSPTATVLDRLAAALGATVASLFEPAEATVDVSPLMRAADQSCWVDPASHYQRRNLSPPGQPIQLVEVEFPAGQRVAYETGPRGGVDVHQQVWLLEGRMRVSSGDQHWELQAGDCLAMQLDQPTSFHNPTRKPARYLVALVHAPAVRRSR